jgi:carboxyl-terminal processing protease
VRPLVPVLIVMILSGAGRPHGQAPAPAADAAPPAPAWRDRALASFDTVWQTIDESYFDPSFGGVNWRAVRDELRPRAERAPTPDESRAVIREMLGRLHRSHFTLLAAEPGRDAPAGDAVVPMTVRLLPSGIVITAVEAGSSAERAGLHPGDRLLDVDGHPAAGWIAAAEAADGRTRAVDAWQRASAALRGLDGSTAALRVMSPDGTDRTVTVIRERPAGDIVKLGNLPPLPVHTESFERRTPRGRRVGVIRFNVWMTAVAGPVAVAIDTYRDASGIVIDLRGNPGGLADMIRGVAGHFLAEPVLLGRMHLRGSTLEFRANPRRSTSDGRRVEPFAGPVAVLVDELTASTSECFTGALQGLGRVRVFGSRTMGQALPAVTRELPNGDVLLYAVGDFTTAGGVALEGQGVVPDRIVSPTVAGLAGGRDEPLEAALDWVDQGGL